MLKNILWILVLLSLLDSNAKASVRYSGGADLGISFIVSLGSQNGTNNPIPPSSDVIICKSYQLSKKFHSYQATQIININNTSYLLSNTKFNMEMKRLE